MSLKKFILFRQYILVIILLLDQCFSNSGARPPRGRDALLKGVGTTPGNRYFCLIFIDNDLISSEWGARNIFSYHEGCLAKNV